MRFVLLMLVVCAAVWLAFTSLFTVDRAEFVYLTQFGKHVATYDGRTDAGLHLKWPWPVQSVQRLLDNRLQFFDLREVELLTHDPKGQTIDKTLMISACVSWRVAGGGEGVDQFIRAVSTPQQAEAILELRIRSQLGAEIGKLSLDQLINAAPGSHIDQNMDELRARLLGADADPAGLRRVAREKYGIELVDIQLRRFNHPPSVRSDIFARITSEREKKAMDYTIDGDKKAAEITSAARLKAEKIKTDATAKAKRLKEGAAVEADRIRNEAQGKDPEFYAFLQKLETYKGILNKSQDVLLLSSKNEIFDMLLKPPPRKSGKTDDQPMKPEAKPATPVDSRGSPKGGG